MVKKDRTKTKKQKAAIYVRVSTAPQIEGTSIDHQLKRCNAWCQANDYSIYQTYRDEGISGAKDKERPGFQSLLDDAEAGKFDIVICSHLDRFARSLRVLLDAVDRLEHSGIHFVCTEQAINTSDKHLGRVFLELLGVFAGWERTTIAERFKGGKVYNVKNGKFIGGQMPLGFENTPDGKVIINQREAEVIKQIFKLAENNGCMAITRILNSKSIPRHRTKIQFSDDESRHCLRYNRTRNSGYCKVSTAWGQFGLCKACAKKHNGILLVPVAWSTSIVRKILHNRKYIGEVEWGNVAGSNPDMKIITSKQFQKVQKRMSQFAQESSRAKSSPHLLTGGILQCYCGENFVCIPKRDAYWYQCSGRRNKKICDQRMFNREKLEEQIIEQVQEFIKKHRIDLTGKISETEQHRRKAEIKEEIKFNKKALKKHKDKLAQITNKLIHCKGEKLGVLSVMLEREAAKESRKIFIAEESLRFLEGEDKLIADKEYQKVLKKLTQRGMQFKVLLEHLQPDLRKNLLKIFIKRVVVDKKAKPQIEWQNLANISLLCCGRRQQQRSALA